MLNGFEVQVFMNIHQVTDETDGRYKMLCDFLNGAGCEDIETAWQELIYKKLYAALKTFTEKSVAKILKEYEASTTEPSSTKKADNAAKKAGTTATLSAKKLTEIVSECKTEAIDFYKEAYKTAGLKGSAEKAYTLFKSRVKTVTGILNAKEPKKPADLNKVLARCTDAASFTKLMLLGNDKLRAILLSWALAGEFAENGFATEWNLGRKFNEFLNKNYRADFQKLFILAANSASTSTIAKNKKDAAYKVVSFLTESKFAGPLSGVNTFDNVKWFNKEMMENSLNQIEMLMLLSASKDKAEEVIKFFKLLNAARVKAAYKCELFLKQFESAKKKPVAKKESTEKKTVAVKKASTAKKTAAKKAPAKKKKDAE